MSATTIPVVKNAIAGASDVVFQASRLDILGCVTKFPTVNYKQISTRSVIKKSLVEIVQIDTITYTPASNTTYWFTITQDINNNGTPTIFTIKYTSDSTGTDAEIATALVNAVNTSGAQVTATGSATPITLTANAGYPLFQVTVVNNSVTRASAQTGYTPSGTANLAITSVIAPDGTAGTAIAGTTTITVTTSAAHLLRPGDVVAIASVATLTLSYTDNVPFSATYGKTFAGVAGGTFRVATVPSATTFTLDGVTGNGGTNSGTITINTRSVAFLTTSGSTTITTGKKLAIAGVATMTIAPITNNVVGTAGASGTFRVGVGGTGTRFLIENVNPNGSLNSGTITITEVAQQSRGDGAVLYANGITDATTTNTYSQVEIPNAQLNSNTLDTVSATAVSPLLYFNEGDADYNDFFYALQNVLEGRTINTVANPNGYSANS